MPYFEVKIMQEIVKVESQNLLEVKDPLALFAEFLRMDVANGYASPETVRSYFTQVREFMEWCRQRNLHPAGITEQHIKAYREYLIANQYAKATIANKLTVIKRFYDMVVSRGLRQDNPAKGVKPPKEKTDRSEMVKWLPISAIQQILHAPDATTLKGKRDRAILSLMALHGLRVMEVASLTMPDIDLANKSLKVMGKGGKVRTIYLVDFTADLLRDWLQVRTEVAKTDHVFIGLHHNPSVSGKGMNRRGLRKVVDTYLTSLGLKKDKVSCHSLRHSYATQSLAAGAKLMAISDALGHSSVTTTQVYAKLVDKVRDNPTQLLVGLIKQG